MVNERTRNDGSVMVAAWGKWAWRRQNAKRLKRKRPAGGMLAAASAAAQA